MAPLKSHSYLTISNLKKIYSYKNLPKNTLLKNLIRKNLGLFQQYIE